MKSGVVILVVGTVIALSGVGGWIYFIHSYTTVPLAKALTYDVVGAVGVVWLVLKVMSWAAARMEGGSPSGNATP